MSSTAEKRRVYRRLHQSGCFVIPNPWDVGSARYLQDLGFAALATTSAGAAFSMGRPDSDRAVSRDMMLAHIREIAAASDLPVNADFGSGYAEDPETVAQNVKLCVETGVAGLSIEDSTGEEADPLHPLDHAVARIRAARAAIDQSGADVVLTGRAECFVVGRPDLDDAIRRLVAYSGAGADCLYAPGIGTREQIAAVVQSVAPKPVNVLVGAAIGLTRDDLAALGVRRISLGSALARTAWGAFVRAARAIAEAGRFDVLGEAIPVAELNRFFGDDLTRRQSSPSSNYGLR